MADTKITALTALTAADPANDVIPIVDVSDTSMAASGTTKKISVNNILGASGTATLASATITGDLTVDTNVLKVDTTNNYVGIGTASPVQSLTISGEASVRVGDLIYWNAYYNVGFKARAAGYAAYIGEAGTGDFTIANTSASAAGAGSALAFLDRYRITNGGVFTWENAGNVAGTAMTLNSAGLGIGAVPSAWGTYKALQVSNASLWGAANNTYVGANYYFDGSSRKYIANGFASEYSQVSGVHAWFNAPSGIAGVAFGFTQAMTLDASGNLMVGSTTNTNSSRVFIRNGSAASPSLALQGITGDTNQAGLLVGKFDNDSTTSQILVRFTINDNSGGSGQINANGASQAAFGSYSDSRLKENIVSLPSQLANILSLRPVEFDYKDGSGHQIGFVAQEIQKVYSDTVGEQDGFLTVTGWSKTEARLVSAIKELAAKVQALEAKLA